MNRYGYEARLLELLETLVKDMDRKIVRQKERAVKESAPRLLTSTDREKLDDILARQKGERLNQSIAATRLGLCASGSRLLNAQMG